MPMTDEERSTRFEETTLDSWKAIAAHLKRDVRTVKRWEKLEGLPVHRHLHQARSSVYAYPSEIAAWSASRKPQPERTAAWRRPLSALAFAAVLMLSLLLVADAPFSAVAAAQEATGQSGMVARQIWTGPGVPGVDDETVTPDGRFLVFSNGRDLSVRNLATGENRQLTNNGPSIAGSVQSAEFPLVSPDGTLVAYSWFNNGVYELRIVQFGAMPQASSRVVYRNEDVQYWQPHAWSPDGARIVIAIEGRTGTYQIVLISAEDGGAQILKSLEWRAPQKVSFSPDGRYIAYDVRVREDSPDRDIFILSVDGRREIPLVQSPAIDHDAVWTPDGKRILFASDRRGNTGLWMIQVGDGKPQGAPELLKPDMGGIASLGFSRDGSYYYGVRTRSQDVYVAELNPETGDLSRPPVRLTERFQGSNLGGAWSPDGRKLAYFSRRGTTSSGPGNMAVVIRSLDTGEEREFFSNLAFNRRWPIARWSPDGQSLLLATRDNRGRGSLHRMDAHTGTVNLLLQSLTASNSGAAVDSRPCISPDGRTIYYFQSTDGTEASSVMAYDTDTGRQQELERSMSPRRITSLACSKDGKWLAFLADSPAKGGSESLNVLPIGGGEPREIFRPEQGGDALFGVSGIEWTHDDRFILLLRRHLGKNDLWRISPHGGTPQKVLSGDGFELLSFPRVHPDGRRLAFTAGEDAQDELWVLENFLPALNAAK
jgi:Tol biopolymer transport system component